MTIRPEVMRFAQHMEAKLRENDHKEHWRKGYTMDHLWDNSDALESEVAELLESLHALNNGQCTAEEVIKECADVALFAMMIADLLDVDRPEATPRHINETRGNP